MTENNAKEQVHTVFQNISSKYDRLNNIVVSNNTKYGVTCNERYAR